jgi:quinoprotein dehydrogenase-associated probable ABC transporter substrate-binding protein
MSANNVMRMGRRSIGLAATALGLVALTIAAANAQETQQKHNSAAADSFRACADPNNLPFSDQAKEGFENKLADLIAADLGEKVSYAWHAQRRGFIRETLKAKKCDVIMGVPTQLDMVEVTQPYYRSAYVFVSRADRHLDIRSIRDPRLRTLKIGVQLIGDDGFNTPPSHALADQGIIRNLVGYPVYGDYREPNPPARIVTAVEQGDVDIAAVWGPLAGYFAEKSSVPLTVTPITDTASFAPLIFQYDIALGVRKGDHARKEKLDQIITRKRPQIAALLARYGIPTLTMPTKAGGATGDGHASR